MQKIVIILAVFGLLCLSQPAHAAIEIDGEFDDWEDIESVTTDTADLTGDTYYWDGVAYSTIDPGNAIAYTRPYQMLDILDLKMTEADGYFYVYNEMVFPMYCVYYESLSSYLPYGMKYGVDTMPNAPEDYDHNIVFSFDVESDGTWDYFLTPHITYSEGDNILLGEPSSTIYFYENILDNEFDADTDTLLNTFTPSQEMGDDFGPDLSGTSGKAEFSAKTSEIFANSSMSYNDTVTVRAETHSSIADVTETGTYTFAAEETGGTLAAPDNLRVQNRAVRAATLKWDEVEGADSYNIQLREKTTSADLVKLWEGRTSTTRPVKKKHLLSNKAYKFRVQAEGGKWSDYQNFRTKPRKPRNLKANKVSDTTAILKWDKVPRKINKYHVSVYDRKSNSKEQAVLTNKLLTKVTGLTPDTRYYFRVKAKYSKQNKSKLSAKKYFRTEE